MKKLKWSGKNDIGDIVTLNNYISAVYVGLSSSGKTSIWDIFNVQSDCHLGIVKWQAPWRQYCFYPVYETIFNEDCLSDISRFLETENTRRRINANNT